MNNKGFAVSTIVYGLSIMGILLVVLLMSVMSSNRSNSTQLVKSIEDELNRFSKTETTFQPSKLSNGLPRGQTYTVPVGETGWYRIELWGSQGKSSGGKGSYTSGIIKLEDSRTLTFYVGDGGHATDVRILGGNYDDENSYSTRIMVAAGGGKETTAHGGTLCGYNVTLTSPGGTPTTQTLLGYQTTPSITACEIGIPFTDKTSPGPQFSEPNKVVAHGYILSKENAYGGSSFISGYGGSNALTKNQFTGQPVYTHYNTTFKEDENRNEYVGDGKIYFFRDPIMIPGVNVGEGKARIQRVLEGDVDFPIRNPKLLNVRYIRDCVQDGATLNPGTLIYAVTLDGEGLAPTVQSYTAPNPVQCKYVDLGVAKNLAEISVFHNVKNKDYLTHQIFVSSDANTWIPIKNTAANKKSVTESISGTHISIYQPDAAPTSDYTKSLPDTGNYYLMPVMSENEVLTAQEAADQNVLLAPFTGLNLQKWIIDKKEAGYTITSLGTNHSFNIAGNTVNTVQRDEANRPILTITAVGDGTYRISQAATGPYLYVPGAGTKNVSVNANQDFARFRLIYIN